MNIKKDFDEEGYLGEQISQFRNEIILKFDKLFSMARDFNRFLQKEKFKFPFQKTQQHALISTIFCRSINSYQTVLILLSFGLTSEAEVILRSLMEATFSLCACCLDDNFCKEYLKSFHAQRLRLAKNVHYNNFFKHLRETPHVNLKTIKAKCEEEGAREIKVKELAEKAKMEYYYYGPYWDLSLSSHISPKSTERYLQMKDNNAFFLTILPDPDPERYKVLMIIAVDMIIRNLKILYELLKLDEPEVLSKMFNDWKGIISEKV